MASGLIGITVFVTLRQPPATVVQGIVAAVNEQTSTLILHNVYFPATGHRLEAFTVEGSSIADIKVHTPAPAPPPLNHHHEPPQVQNHPSYGEHHQSHVQVAVPNTHQHRQTFVDPAIVSVGKKPSHAPLPGDTVSAMPQEAPATPIKPLASATAAPLPTNTSPFVGIAKDRYPRKPSAATLAAPFSSINIADAGEQETDDATVQGPPPNVSKTRTSKLMNDLASAAQNPDESPAKPEDSFKKTRRGGKARRKESTAQERRGGTELNSSPETARKGKGNGWRQTPLLQDPDQPSGTPQSRTPGVIGGSVGLEAANSSNRKTRRQKALEARNGWATEDATDIQELPEFDFAENLSKFDKRSVFDQIRNEDTTADEDRLVSFNRIARPGTYGGKNLHPTENVLDSRRALSASGSSSSDNELTDFGSGRNSRRALSRTSTKRVPTRQGSGVQGDGDGLSRSGAAATMVARATRSFVPRPYATSSHATGSPKPGRTVSPPGSPSLESSTTRPCFKFLSNGRKCNTITPGGMLAVEESAEIDFGLTEDMIAEHAGRGIVEVALSTLNPGGRRLARENHNAKPVIVVLAGNHRTGARAIAAARQLQARGPRVMVALLGFERPVDWDKDVRRQVELFRKFGGWVRAWNEVEDKLKRLQAPPELIIDALLGRHKEFDALGEEDRRRVLGIVGWANKSRASVLAIETPSGVGGGTGEVAILEGEPLEVRAKYIVCLGAPRSGLLKALQNGAGRDPEWLIWVVDIGVNQPWKNAGIRGGKGVQFGEYWSVQIAYSEGDVEDDGVRS